MDPIKSPAPQETKLHFLDYWRIIRIRKTIILAVFLLVVLTATLVTFVLPETFASTAKIRIERDNTDIPSMQQGSYGGGYDPFFIQTEFELIQSEEILGKVIEKPVWGTDPTKAKVSLSQWWGSKLLGPGQTLKPQETLIQVRNHLSLNAVRNTSFIEIRATSGDANEAAQLANEVAQAYEAYRKDKKESLTKGGIKALEERWNEQEVKVREAQSNVDYLRITLNIPDSMASADVPSALLTSESLRRLIGDRIEAKTELARQETLLDKLKSLAPGDQVQAIPTASGDSLLSSRLELLTMVDQKLIAARKDYGTNHIELQKLELEQADLQTKIMERVKGVLLGLDAKVASLSNSLQELEAAVDTATSNDIWKAGQSRPYFEAKHHLEEVKHFSQMLTFKIESENTDLMLPKSTMVEIDERAKPAMGPFSPKKTLNIALGVVVGLVVGIGLAFFIEYLDTSVKTIDDVERSLGAPVLGVIPQNVGLILDEGADSPHAEAYRVLRTNLLFSRKDDKLNTVAIVSAGAGEGKSTTVFNLASIFAQSGSRVLIVDSDLRRPTLHKMMRVANNLGLTNYLLKQNSLEEVIQTTSLPTMDFMASGKLPSSSLGILSSAQMKELIGELKQHYDFVFFDSPPVMGVSDASILASEVDMTIQVIQYRRYPQPMNIRAKQLIEKVGGNLVGIVLNNINMSQDESYYYYSGYYHDYYSKDEDEEPSGAGDKTNKNS
jgi:polysaccharide biosynthesis transport protein